MSEPHAPNLADASLKKSLTLPNGANTTYSAPIDLESQIGDHTSFLAMTELRVKSPVVTTAELPDGQTLTYFVESDNDVTFGTAKTLAGSLLVVTGAGGAGAAEAIGRFKPSTNVERYIRIGCTKTGAADASTAAAEGALVF